jgi:transcriptional regulator with XRE-family HTH domain
MSKKVCENVPLFGKKLRALRKSRNLDQEELAKALGVSRETISYYENRAKNPTAELVNKIASFFEVPPETLLFNITDKDRKKTGSPSKLDVQLDMVRKLPPKKQKTISEMLDMVLNK